MFQTASIAMQATNVNNDDENMVKKVKKKRVPTAVTSSEVLHY